MEGGSSSKRRKGKEPSSVVRDSTDDLVRDLIADLEEKNAAIERLQAVPGGVPAGNDIDLRLRCITCYAKERDTYIDPCGHVSCCAKCLEIHKATMMKMGKHFTCPVCRERITDTKPVIIS